MEELDLKVGQEQKDSNLNLGLVLKPELDNLYQNTLQTLLEKSDLSQKKIVGFLSKYCGCLDTVSGKMTALKEILKEIGVSLVDFEDMVGFVKNRTDRIIKLDNYLDNVTGFWKTHPFFYDKSNLFWLWDHKEFKYDLVDDVDMMILLDKTLHLQGQTINSKIKGNYLEAFKRVGRIKIPKDAPEKWMQFKNKAYSLTSGKIYDVKPNFFFVNPIPWELGKSTETPMMDKLIIDWVGEKYKDTAYEVIAYCCYRNYPIHTIVGLVGSGCNGKSKYLGLITKFIGSFNACSTELDTLINSRFESFKLYKKLACIMGETNFGVLNKTSLLKRLTGQDLIGFEFKNKKPFDDYNYAKILISSNSLPVTHDTSEGYMRRWLILEFNNQFKEGTDILGIIPEIEYNNLALKITKVLEKLLKRGQFKLQGSIKEREEKYILASNPLSYFLKMKCKKEEEGFIRYSEIYTAYRKYLYENKKRRVGYKEFNDVLAMEGIEIRRTSKKIGETFVNDRFVEGLVFKDGCVRCDTYHLVSHSDSLCKNVSENLNTKDTNDTKNLTPIQVEELITPFITHCRVCRASPCHFFYKGLYFCTKICLNAYMANNKG